MFVGLKGRSEPTPGVRVRAYRNLNKPSFFSILAMEGPDKGKVLGYSRCVQLRDVTFIVSEKTRARVVREKCRTVHAFAEGIYTGASESPPPGFIEAAPIRVTYQPFLCPTFFLREEPTVGVQSAQVVMLFGADCLSQGVVRHAA